MIGSIGEEASKIRDALPPGQGHVVLDTALLPSVFRRLDVTALPCSLPNILTVSWTLWTPFMRTYTQSPRSIFEQAGMICDEL